MPTVKISAVRFRQAQMPPTEYDFMRTFGAALAARGFRISESMDENERLCWQADPKLKYERIGDELIVSQEVPGRVNDEDARLVNILSRIRHGESEAIADLYGYLLANQDDRAKLVASVHSYIPEEAEFFSDTGSQTGRPGQEFEADHPIITGEKLAQKELCEKVLMLFGKIDVPI